MLCRFLSLLTCLCIFGCAKESLVEEPQGILSNSSACELMVKVSLISWGNENCGDGCIVGTQQLALPMANVHVMLYAGHVADMDQTFVTPDEFQTDTDGRVMIYDLPEGPYTVFVDTPLGQQSKQLYTRKGERATLEITF